MREPKPTDLSKHGVLLIVLSAAVAGALIAPAATGGRIVDGVVSAGLVALVAWLGGVAPPPLVAAAAGVFVVVGLDRPVAAALAAVALVAIAVLSFRRRTDRRIATAAAGLVALAALLLPPVGFFGGSALLAGAVLLVVMVAGLRTRTRAVRRRVVFGAVFTAEAAVIFAGLAAGPLVRSRHQLADATAEVRTALSLLDDGQVRDATAMFERAGALLDEVDDRLAAPWSRLGLLVPVVAQHQRAALELNDAAGELVEVATEALALVDPERATLAGGRFDVDAIDAMAPPLAKVVLAAERLDGRLDDVTSPWLVDPARVRLDELSDELAENLPRLRTLSRATDAVAVLLGSDEPQRYFVAFVTPSEARPGGGHLGNYAELTLDAGRLALDRIGRTEELLDRSSDPAARIITGPPEYLARYSVFGAGGDGAPAKPEWWQLVNISPDFPSVGQVVAELYPQTGGPRVNGVISIDPFGLAAVLRLTGPVTVGEPAVQLSADNVVAFLSRDQYLLLDEIRNEERAELLGEAARAAFDALLTAQGIDPVELLRSLGEAVATGHLRLWSGDAFVQSVFTEIGAAGAFERTAPSDALAVNQMNSGGNKLDAFLERKISYTASVGDDGGLTAYARVELTNTAPAEGLPDYVIGNVLDDPTGTNRTFTIVYTPHQLVSMKVDGEAVTPLPPATGQELGWNYVEWEVLVPAGGTVVLEYELAGSVPTDVPYSLEWVQQPMARPDQVRLVATADGGETVLVDVDQALDRSRTFRSPE